MSGDPLGPVVFEDDLIAKYDTAAPRYTSYPTAPQFHPGFDAAALERVLKETNRPEDSASPPISLYFHLPFCRHMCLFCGCNVTIARDLSRAATYADDVRREMDLVAPLVRTGRRVEQLHWGGGTPTFFPPEVLEDLFEWIAERFPFAPGAEVGVEIDPRETTDSHLETLASCGFNRLSLGIQDLDPRVQAAVQRIQPEDMTRRVIEKARSVGFKSVNVDLIYGLPHQTLETFERTVDAVIGLDPDRIALFNFAFLPEMIRHQRALDAGAMPGPDEKLEILKMAVRCFTAAGLEFIGMDHFARKDDELFRALRDRTLHRNFQGYTTKSGCDLFGFGVSAISQIGRSYSQNRKDVASWTEAVRAGTLPVTRGIELSDDDVLRRDVITRLMCHFTLRKPEIEASHGVDFDTTFAKEIERLGPLEKDGLVKLEPDRIDVLPRGRFLVRNVAAAFDAYIDRAGQRYSRTI